GAKHKRELDRFVLVVDTEQLGHLLVFKAQAWNIRLDPLIVEHELRDGAFAGLADYFLSRTRRLFNVDFLVGNIVLGEPALSHAAVATPRSGIDDQFHIDLLEY